MRTESRIVVGLLAVLTFVAASCMNEMEDVPDFNEQLEKDVALIDAYVGANATGTVVEHNSGIRYVIHKDSIDGVKPTIDSCVTANYVGKLMSTGQVFDDGTGVSFPLSGVIDGWKIAIPLLNEGDSATLYIPSGYAYGYYGYPPEIPKNANLIFHVSVKNVGSTYTTTNNTGSCN